VRFGDQASAKLLVGQMKNVKSSYLFIFIYLFSSSTSNGIEVQAMT